MSATKITDLLPIPAGMRQPHPYQVFGLTDGEQDPKQIAAAVKSVVSRLKAAKPDTDPKLWQQAARLVKGAQEILSDPEKKAALDARFGIVSMDAINETDNSPADALAAFLPASDPAASLDADPLASVLPTVNPLAPVTVPDPHASEAALAHPADAQQLPSDQGTGDQGTGNTMPPGLFGTPDTSDDSSQPVTVTPQVVKAPRKRRKRSIVGPLIALTFAFIAFAVIGGVVYFLIAKPGQLAITVTDDGFSISAQEKDAGGQTIAQDLQPPDDASQETTPHDAILGGLAPDKQSTNPSNASSGLASGLPELGDGGAADKITLKPIEAAPNPPAMSENPLGDLPLDPPPATDTNASTTMPQGDAPAAQPAMEPLTEAMIAEADQTLDHVRELIQSAKWSEMKQAAEAALEQRMSETQQADAQALFEVAELATYYRVGIEKAVADLKVGNDFEVTEDFRVIVVETGPDRLVVRFNAKNAPFTFNELPWPLAHKLAMFTMPDNPSTQAAKAVYQAIAPKTNDGYRTQALEWLDAMEDEVEGSDPQRLSETIRSLFPES